MIYTNSNSSFPDQVVPDPEKQTLEYGLQVARAIENEWFGYSDNGVWSVYGSRYSTYYFEPPSFLKPFHSTKARDLVNIQYIIIMKDYLGQLIFLYFFVFGSY